MIEDKKIVSKFYYPQCRENKCDGVLTFTIEDNFTIDYHCEKNANHKGKNIYFKTFKRFYLKEKEINNCFICSSILGSDIVYKCIKCDKHYCALCFINDKHIKEDINNLKIKSKKCELHKRDLIYYCINCKKFYCPFCLKNNEKDNNENNHDKNHNIKNLIELIPSKEQINNLKNKIELKSKFYEELINILNKYQNTFITKINQLKENLKDEISILRNICFNFNQYFLNYNYYSIFYYLEKYINNKNKELFTKLKNTKTYNFVEQTKIIFELFNYMKKNTNNKIIIKKGVLDNFYPKKYGIIQKINNDYYCDFIESKEISLNKFNKEKDLMNIVKKISFEEKIYSVSCSTNKNQIYLCLFNEKVVKILEYNLENKGLKMSKNKIIDNDDMIILHFNKCINLVNDYLATSDNKMIGIWNLDNTNSNSYSNIKRINLINKTLDLLLVNNDYFISSQPKNETITIIDIKSLTQEKIIPKIDSIESVNCLLLYKEYIIINCIKGIAIFVIKTKEISQYIEYFKDNYSNKEIFLDYNDNICILDRIKTIKNIFAFTYKPIIKIMKYKMIDGLLEPFVEYEEMIVDDYDINIFSINKGDLILWGNNVYVLKELSE